MDAVTSTRERAAGARSAVWIALPQVVTRLVSFYIFAVVARATDADTLGALSLGVSIGGVAVPLAPAIIGKPLSVVDDHVERVRLGRLSTASAVWVSTVAAVAMAVAAVFAHGLTRLAFTGAAIALPTVMIIESSFWRSVFVQDRRTAALWYSGAYLAQAAIVTACIPFLSDDTLVVLSFLALVPSALVTLLRSLDLSPAAACEWVLSHRHRWVPYVVGTLAGLGVVQSIPTVLTATAGFEAAGVYRAGELAFGGTNLVIGIAVQVLLTQRLSRPRRAYLLASALLVAVAVANGIVLMLLPEAVLTFVFGATAGLLTGVLVIVTVQRAAMGPSSAGNIVIIPKVSARVAGLLDVVAAATQFVGLVIGALLDGLHGGLIGLATAEVLLALGAGLLLRRRT